MSVNRNQNKIYLCTRYHKEDPDTSLEVFELRALNPTYARRKLDKRFFLNPGEDWKIERLQDKEISELTPWR